MRGPRTVPCGTPVTPVTGTGSDISKAFERSKMIISTCFFWTMLRCNSSVVIMSFDSHECRFLKLC